MGSAQDGDDLLLGGQGDGAGHGGAVALGGLHDLLSGLVDDLVVIGLQANANHFFCHLVCSSIFRTVCVLRGPRSVRREEFLYAHPCVSFQLIRNTGTNSGRCHSGTAIYAGVEVLLSRPIIGHTPRKLPPCGAISRFIAFVNAPGCAAPMMRVPAYNIGKPPFCQGGFRLIFIKF